MATVREIVVEKILKGMADGVAPWHRPWFMQTKRNGFSGHEYRGINRLLMSLLDDVLFFTFKQVKELGGTVKAGEKGNMIVFWKPKTQIKTIGADGAVEEKTIPLLRYYLVFGMSQVDFPEDVVEKLKAKMATPETQGEQNVDADAWIDALAPNVHPSDKAYYSPATDDIGMPPMTAFESMESYYSTMFHEIGHWTGHASRCDRHKQSGFADQSYAREELVAEIAAAMACHDVGITAVQAPAYVKAWAERIADDPNIIFSASTKAEQAHEWMRSQLLK